MELNVFEYFKGYRPTTPGPRTPEEQGTAFFLGGHLNRGNYAGPTEAKYAKLSARDEIARERILQKDYERIWLPPPVKHSPWED
jgi:hypothetical protein